MFKQFLSLTRVGLLSALPFTGLVSAQEYRATITGIVTDSSKGAIPNATISVRNLDTNEVIQVKTSASGAYTVGFLHPGHRLEVSAEAPGFKKATYPPVVLDVAQTQTADFKLEVGEVTEKITVRSEAYEVGLDTGKADRGIVVDNKTITELPLNGRTVLSFLDTVAGVTNEAGPGLESVPTDMFNISFFTVNGGTAQNTEYQIDGMPDNSVPWYNAMGPSSIPSVDAIQEFKVITNPYDASLGRTSGGVVSMELKSGTNSLHGSAYEFAKRTFMDANLWANNAASVRRQAHTDDQYGFEVAGPVYLPKLYNGQNKTFFMFNWEYYKAKTPNFQTFELPSVQWLQGNFTNFTDIAANCVDAVSTCTIPIYDPLTGNASDPSAPRSIIKNSAGVYNMIEPSRLNPIALTTLNMMLALAKPTTEQFPGELPWESIWVNTQPNKPYFNNFIVKGDQVLGNHDHLSVSYIHDHNESVYLATPPAVWQNGSDFTEYHLNAAVDWVHILRSNLTSDVRVSYQRYWRTDGYPNSQFDPTTLGFPSSLISQLPFQKGFPQISFTMQQAITATGNGYNNFLPMSRDWYYFPDDTFSVSPSVSWIKNKHNLRFGVDYRDTRWAQNANWTNTMQFDSNGFATSEYWNANNFNDQNVAADGTELSGQSGNAIADWLLSQPHTVSVTNQREPLYTWHYWAPWFQDDWKITPRLTLNLGFRYDLNGPPLTRHNWLNTGFDFTSTNPVDAEIDRTTYPNFPTVTGGITFPKTSGRNTPWVRDYTKVQPRIGFAYQINSKTVVRGGFGRLVLSPVTLPMETGFSNPPVFLNSLNNGQTLFSDNLTNPFVSSGGIPAIPGDSQGLLTYVGKGIAFINPNFKLPYVNQGSFGIQRALPNHAKMDVSFVSSRSYDQPVTYTGVDANPTLYESCNQTLGTAAKPQPRLACIRLVSNPFYGLAGVSGSLALSPTVSAYQLSRPHAQFTGISEQNENWGKSWYNSLQTTYNQRVSWVLLNASWTWSKTMQSGGYVDDVYLIPMRSIAGTDRAHRVTLQSVLDLPVGKGRKYFASMNRVLDTVIGGWTLGSSFFWESGQPVSLPSGWNLLGNIQKPKQNVPGLIDLGVTSTYELWYNGNSSTPGCYYTPPNPPSSCLAASNIAWQRQAPYGPHTEQPYTDAIRAPGTQQIDANLAKGFHLGERFTLETRLEMFNVLNHPTFFFSYDMSSPTSPTFGTVNKALFGQSNSPRIGQLGIKVTW